VKRMFEVVLSAEVGVPGALLKSPDELSVNPGGRMLSTSSDITVNPSPLPTVSCWLYGVPTLPKGSVLDWLA